MMGMTKEALKILSEGAGKATSSDQISVASTSLQMQLPDRLSPQSISMVNQAAVKLCANNILGAKETLDELMTQLDVKLVTTVSSSDSMLPQYLVHTLVYFFLKTSKFLR